MENKSKLVTFPKKPITVPDQFSIVIGGEIGSESNDVVITVRTPEGDKNTKMSVLEFLEVTGIGLLIEAETGIKITKKVQRARRKKS